MSYTRGIAAALAVALASPAAALSIDGTSDFASQQTGDMTVTASAVGDTATIDFNYLGTPITGSADFTVDGTAEVFFGAYTPDPSGTNDVSGIILSALDGPGGTETSRLTTETSNCTAASGAIAPVAGDCNLITESGSTRAGVDATAPDSVNPIFTLMPGSYRLGFFDNAQPSDALVSFSVEETSVIPLPASVLLLAGGLAGFGLVGRMRRGA